MLRQQSLIRGLTTLAAVMALLIVETGSALGGSRGGGGHGGGSHGSFGRGSFDRGGFRHDGFRHDGFDRNGFGHAVSAATFAEGFATASAIRFSITGSSMTAPSWASTALERPLDPASSRASMASDLGSFRGSNTFRSNPHVAPARGWQQLTEPSVPSLLHGVVPSHAINHGYMWSPGTGVPEAGF